MPSNTAVEPVSTTQSTNQRDQQFQRQTDRAAPNEAATKLIESIDDFLSDIEKKFKSVSNEILGRLDDMAERCDRLEQDMLLGGGGGGSKTSGSTSATGKEAIATSGENRRGSGDVNGTSPTIEGDRRGSGSGSDREK